MGRRWPARCGTVALVAIADAHVDQRQVRAAVRRPHAPRRRPAGRSLGSTLVTAAAARDACRRRRTAADAAAYSKQAALARQAHARLGGSTCARNAAVARRLRRGVLTTPAAQARLCARPHEGGSVPPTLCAQAPRQAARRLHATLCSAATAAYAPNDRAAEKPGPNPALSTSPAVQRFVRLARNHISLAVALQMVL